jgi:hypothetical protein
VIGAMQVMKPSASLIMVAREEIVGEQAALYRRKAGGRCARCLAPLPGGSRTNDAF